MTTELRTGPRFSPSTTSTPAPPLRVLPDCVATWYQVVTDLPCGTVILGFNDFAPIGSVAIITARIRNSPPSVTTNPALALVTVVLHRTDPAGSESRSCSGSACIPVLGTAGVPVTNDFRIKSMNRREVCKSGSRKTPVKKGRRTLLNRASSIPAARSATALEKSSSDKIRCAGVFAALRA